MYVNSSLSALTNTVLSGSAAVRGVKAQLALGSSALSAAASSGSTYTQAARKLPAEATSFMANFRTNMEELKSAATAVTKPAADKTTADSSNTGVAAVSGRLQRPQDSYTLEVSQVAHGQINRTGALSADAPLPTLGGTLEIKTGAGSFSLSLNAGGYANNREMLRGYAERINNLGSGLSAKVVESEGDARLEITGEGAFSLSGSFARRTGLDEVATEGREAIFSLSKNGGETESFTSSTNTVEVDGLTVQLKSAGSTTLGAGQNPDSQITRSLEKLVDSYNKSISFLGKNEDKGLGVLRQTKRLMTLSTSERSLNQIGISVKSDGALSVDNKKLTEALSRDRSFATGIINRLAESISKDAATGLSESAYNLISGTLGSPVKNTSAAGLSGSYDNDAFRMMNSYNRSGVYNAMNMMVVGALMNVSA